MQRICPCCHQPLPADAVDRDAAALREWCLKAGEFVTHDNCVYESTAALILRRSTGTLANWRVKDRVVIPFCRSGKGARVRYRLSDLADALVAQEIKSSHE